MNLMTLILSFPGLDRPPPSSNINNTNDIMPVPTTEPATTWTESVRRPI